MFGTAGSVPQDLSNKLNKSLELVVYKMFFPRETSQVSGEAQVSFKSIDIKKYSRGYTYLIVFVLC